TFGFSRVPNRGFASIPQSARGKEVPMRIAIAIAMSAAFATVLPLASARAQNAPPSGDRKLSYALGYEAGRDLGQQKPAYPPQEMQQVITTMQQQMVAEARAAFAKLAATNLARAQKFFAQNKRQKGVIVLPSGVQYRVLENGSSGNSPTIDSEVTLQ